MGRDNQIGDGGVEQHIAVLWRLDGQHVHAGAGDDALAQGAGQRRLVDDAAARGVDDASGLLHRREFFRRNHAFRLRRQRQVQRDDVGLAQDGRDVDLVRHVRHVVDQHLHAERDRAPLDLLAERAIPNDAERRTGDVVDRVIEIAELAIVAPAPVEHRIMIVHEIASQREQQREDMLGQRVEGVVADVGDRDPMRGRIGFVDHVGAGRGDGDQLKIGKLLQDVLAQRNLVCDADVGALEAQGDLGRRGLRIFRVVMREIGLAQIGVERLAVEKNDFVRHSLDPSHGVQLARCRARQVWRPARPCAPGV